MKTLTRLIKLTKAPFYSYRLGITYIQVNEKEKALAAFTATIQTAPSTVYYRKPAEKLARDLAK